MRSGYPLFCRMDLMFSSSCCSLLFEQIINAPHTSVLIKLVLRFIGPNESQQKHCLVKMGFLKTEVQNPRLLFSTKTSNPFGHDIAVLYKFYFCPIGSYKPLNSKNI